jgi:hypothetical protein
MSYSQFVMTRVRPSSAHSRDSLACDDEKKKNMKASEVILKQQKFGRDGSNVSVIGQGTWYLDRGDRKSAVAALRRGIELGMTISTQPRCMATPSS